MSVEGPGFSPTAETTVSQASASFGFRVLNFDVESNRTYRRNHKRTTA